MSYIEENTFAAACCENSIAELKTALEGPADETDMAEWGLTETEWRAGIQQAIVAKLERMPKELDCTACHEGSPRNECPNSKRPCGHHCNHSWSHDECCWCGKEFKEGE